MTFNLSREFQRHGWFSVIGIPLALMGFGLLLTWRFFMKYFVELLLTVVVFCMLFMTSCQPNRNISGDTGYDTRPCKQGKWTYAILTLPEDKTRQILRVVILRDGCGTEYPFKQIHIDPKELGTGWTEMELE